MAGVHRVPTFDGAIVFYQRLPTLRLSYALQAWLKAFQSAGVLPTNGEFTNYPHETTLCILLAHTEKIEVVGDTQPLLDFAEWVKQWGNTNLEDTSAVIALWNSRLDLHNDIIERWWQADQQAQQVGVVSDPTLKPDGMLTDEDKARLAESPLAKPA